MIRVDSGAVDLGGMSRGVAGEDEEFAAWDGLNRTVDASRDDAFGSSRGGFEASVARRSHVDRDDRLGSLIVKLREDRPMRFVFGIVRNRNAPCI